MRSPSATSAGRVDIGHRALYVNCAGDGVPPVILESGYGNGSAVWTTDLARPASGRRMVHAGAASVTDVCAYDRANAGDRPGLVGRSDRVASPRTAAALVADLRRLLTAAGVASPRVLVGHSFGALLVRLYAHQHPDEVAGLVLVDGVHEEYETRLQRIVRPRALAARRRRDALEPNPEGLDLAACCAEVRTARAAHALGRVPLVVLTHGRAPVAAEVAPGWPLAAHERLWRTLQEDLAGLVPGGRLVIAKRSGHYIHQEEPELVVEAIRTVVTAVRTPGGWEPEA